MLLIVVVAALSGFALGNLAYTGMWYDEAVQFWIARGLSPFASPLQAAGGIADAVRLNAVFNLDPGGFTLLLYFWSKIDTGFAWLRLLPLLFFLGGIACLGALAYSWTRSVLAALVSMSLVLFFDIILYHAVEIRAYSMEFAGVMAMLLGTRVALERKKAGWFLVLGLAAAAFMTSRYSFVFVVAATGITLALFLVRDDATRAAARIAMFAWFAAPTIAVGGLILVFSLHPQIDVWLGGSLVHSGAPDYVSHTVLAGKPFAEWVSLAARNLFSWQAIPLTLVTVMGIVLIPVTLRTARPERSVTTLAAAEKHAAVQVGLIAVMSFAVSAAGYYPWDIHSKWSQYLLALSPVSMALLVSISWRALAPGVVAGGRLVPSVVAGAAILVVCLAGWHASDYRHVFWLDLRAPLAYLSDPDRATSRVVVWGYEEPTVKYFFEYGPLRKVSTYPDRYHFMAWNPDPAGACADYVLSPRSADEVAALFPGIVLTRDPAHPAILYRVEAPPHVCRRPSQPG